MYPNPCIVPSSADRKIFFRIIMGGRRRNNKQTKQNKYASSLPNLIAVIVPLVVVLCMTYSAVTHNSASVVVQATPSSPSRTQEAPQKEKSGVTNEQLAVKHLQKALTHIDRKEFDESIDECEHALKANPELTFAHALKGQVFNMVHDWKHAMESWQKAVDLDPENYEYYYHLGFSLQQVATDSMKQSKKHELNKKAISAFKMYLELTAAANAPKSQISAVHAYLANVYKSIKTRDKQELAKQHFIEAVNLDPTNDLAFFNIGLLYVDEYEKTMNEELKEEALTNINKAIELSPTNTHFSLVRDAILGKVSTEELMMSMQHSEL